MYIFVGIAVGQSTQVTNPIVSIDEETNRIHFVNTGTTSTQVVSYNTELENFERHTNSAGLIGNVATKIGWLGDTQTVTHNVEVNEETVVGKIYPV